MVFNPALSREFKPYKPNPAPLLHICSTWGIHPNEIMMIGDSLKDDVSTPCINVSSLELLINNLFFGRSCVANEQEHLHACWMRQINMISMITIILNQTSKFLLLSKLILC